MSRGLVALTIASTMTLSTIASGVAPTTAQAASVGTAAAAVSPADTVLYFGFSLDPTSAQWQLADELLARAGSETGVDELVGEITESAVGSGDPSSLLGGEAAVLVTSLDTSEVAAPSGGLDDVFGEIGVAAAGLAGDELSGAAIVLSPSDLAAATAFLESDLQAEASSQDVKIETAEYNGVTIMSIPGDDMTGETGTAYAVVGDFIVVSETAADIEPVVDVFAGDADSLADLDAFGRADEALAGDRLGFGFANGSAFAESIAEADTSGMEFGNSLDGLFGAGFYSGISVIADPAGFRVNTVQVPGDASGSQQTPVAPATGDREFASKVPADALLFGNGVNLGQGMILQTLGLFLVSAVNSVVNPTDDDATPAALPPAEDLYAQAARLVGFNLKTDFIDQMVGEYGIAVWGDLSGDEGDINAVLASGTESPATVADALAKISLLVQAGAQGQANVTTRVIGDSSVSVIEITEDSGATVTLEYGVVDGEFLLGVGGGIDGYLAGSDEPLSESADYQAALAALPADHRGVFYVNVAEAIGLAESAGSMGDFSSFEDASELCAEYGSQQEAQAAYDEDTVTNFELDLDFDGIACDDYFSPLEVFASPVAGGDYSAVRAFATVTFNQDGLEFTNSILLIAE